MTKAIFKKSLALLLSVMLVLTAFGGALAVFADDEVVEEPAFDYGTEADGFNTRDDNVADDGNPRIGDVPVLAKPTNIDFKEGLKYWTSKHDRNGVASEFATVYTDAVTGEKYVGLNINNNQYDGISTPWFGLGDIADGTKIYVFAEYMVNGKFTVRGADVYTGVAYPMPLQVYQMDAEGKETMKTKFEGPALDDAHKNGIWSTMLITEIDYVAGTTFRLQYQDNMPNDAEAEINPETGDVIKEAVTQRADIAALTDGESGIFVKGLRFCTLNDDGTYTVIGTGEQVYYTGLSIGGTEEEGIPVQMTNGAWQEIYNWGTNASSAKNIGVYAPQEGFYNGDFSEGFKYWTIRWPGKGYGINSVNDVFEITKEGSIKFLGNEKNYLGFGSVPFKLKGVKADDKLVASAKVKNNQGKALRFDLGEVGVNYVRNNYSGSATEWEIITTPELTVSADNATFAIQFESHAGAVAGYEIDDIKVLKINGDGTTTDVMTNESFYADGSPVQPFGGTEADGIIVSNNNFVADGGANLDKTNYAFGVANGFNNGDFSEGFKYYSIKYHNSNPEVDSISDFAEITEEGSLKFNAFPYNYCGLVSLPFYLEGVEADDELKMVLKYKNNTAGFEMRLYEEGTLLSQYTCGTKVTNWARTGTDNFKATVTSGDSRFWIMVQAHDNVGLEIDDLKIIKKISDDFWVDLVTDEKCYKDGTPVGGTFEDGWSFITSGNNAMYMGTFDQFNGDFSQGLKFWTLQNNVAVGKASDAATVKVEDGNTYINVFDTANEWYGIRTLGFSLDKVKAEDKLTIMFNYRNGDLSKHRIFLGVANADTTDGIWSLKTDTYATAVELADGTSWGTALNKNYITVGSAITTKNKNTYCTSDINEKIWFYIEVENAGANVGAIDLDNFQIVKYINEYTVETLDGETIKFAPTWVGTFNGGATLSGNNLTAKYYSDYGVQNGDFSEGFKYWGGKGVHNSEPTIANYMNLVQSDGNTYVQFRNDIDNYKGFTSAKFSIPADKLAVDDYVSIMLDVYDPDNTAKNVQAVLEFHSGNGRVAQGTLNNATVIEDKGNGWKTLLVTYQKALSAASTDAGALAAGDWTGYLMFECTAVGTTTALDNIKIVKKVSDYAVETLDGETVVWDPAWAGTFEGGATHAAAGLNSKYPAEYGVANNDFSKGFKYWGATGGTATSITEYVDLVNDGDNYYVQFDGEVRNGYCGFRTGYLCIPAADLQVGDYVAIKFDLYDPDNTAAAFQVILEARGCESGRVSQTTGNAVKVVADKGNGWKTVVTEFDGELLAACTEKGAFKAGDWVFSIAVEVIGSAKDENGEWIVPYSSTAAFDNFEIVRADRGGFGAKGVIVDLNGNAVEDVNVGDANLDGKVDLVDLVRTKKYAAAQAYGSSISSPISIASVDADGVKGIGAADISAIINKILGIAA